MTHEEEKSGGGDVGGCGRCWSMADEERSLQKRCQSFYDLVPTEFKGGCRANDFRGEQAEYKK